MLVLGPNPTERRPHTVTFVEPTWGDTATWLLDLAPVAGAPTSNLFTRQPSQTAGYDVSAEDLVLQGTRTAAAALDVVAIPYATATPAAQWQIQCGDSANEAVGIRAADASGNNREATRNGATAFVQGKYGSGLRLGNEDHGDDYLESVAIPPEPATYLGWYRPDLSVADRTLWSHDVRRLYADSDGFLRMDGGTEVASTGLVSGFWSHVAVTINTASGVVVIYLDGEVVATETALILGIDPATIRWGSDGTQGFAGTLDDLRTYSRILTQAEIQAEMQSETPTITDGSLQVHYKLNGYDSGLVTFGAPPNLATYARRCGFHLLPYQLTCKVVRITLSDPTNTATLYLGRLWIGPAYQPPRNFDYGFTLGRGDESKATRTPTAQLTTNSRTTFKVITFTLRHLDRTAVMLHLDELQRVYGTSQPLLVCCDPEDDEFLEKMTIHGVLTDLSPFAWQYADGWEASFRVEEMP